MSQDSWKLEQEEPPCPPLEAPSLCSNNCGFFGSPSTMNLCSACYRDLVLLKANAPPSFASSVCLSPSVSSSPPACSVTNSASGLPPGVDVKISSGAPAENPHPQAAPVRCFLCRKRVGLTGFKCRCGDVFCGPHRYSDKHNCSFDYKAAGRAAISKANPVVKADKLQRI